MATAVTFMQRDGDDEPFPSCFQGLCPNPLMMRSQEPLNSHSSKDDEQSKPLRNTSSACRHDFEDVTTSSIFPNTFFITHESLPSFQESFSQFITAYPQYADTRQIDNIRAQEYYNLTLSHHVCLDYIGIGLFSYSQQVQSIPVASPIVNPDYFPFFDINFKSVSLKSQLSLTNNGGGQLPSSPSSSSFEKEIFLELGMKKRIMDFLRISEKDYSLVFTANKSSAFKLVAESYPFQTNRKLLTVYDHSSEALDTLVTTAEKRKAQVSSAEFKWPRLRVHADNLKKMIVGGSGSKKKKGDKGLFVFPLQSRVTGGGYSYQWMNVAQENGWHVLLDACGLGPKDMDSFGLSLFKPDFLVCSFYKVFGDNPTGFGCLVVKNSAVSILENSKTAGIVSLVPQTLQSYSPDSPGLECKCLDQVDSLGLMVVNKRRKFLINWLVTALTKLQHPNRLDGFPLVRIYGPKIKFDRGPALAFNVYDWEGQKVDPTFIQKLADRYHISLSQGFLHNIWFPQKYEEERDRILEKPNNEMEANKKGNKQQGISVVTIALSFLANFEDTYMFWAFIARFLDADFVEKERWRYTAPNQSKAEVL
ncbi:unnamed protein product [Cuscuta epithymum]|uniref:Molybdenum cofactor sulfurase n=1 Tax=Cuscuta epithymum TaxID=186058 RepID=A0AAV0E4K9_9ASTE|nr:unnamed protein product [Cuscuta epithymum]